MNIACIAHDKKKELMIQFCIAYKGIIEKHSLFATAFPCNISGKGKDASDKALIFAD